MECLQGIAVSHGVAIGEALVLDNEGFRIPRRFVSRDAVEDELERLAVAIAGASAEVERNRDRIAAELGDDCAAIFSAHLQMLRDPRLRAELDEMIRQRNYSPEYAVSRALRRYAKVFEELEGGFMAQRAIDVFDIEKRLLRHLLGHRRQGLAHLTSPVIVLARDLTPSETASLNPKFVKGFVTETGGPGSHTAIVAEGLGIPAVVGIGHFLTDVSGGDTVIIDGDQGQVVLDPDEKTLAKYRCEVEGHRVAAAKLAALRDLPAETRDGVQVQLMGNIEFQYEVEQCLQHGGNGIGLYRTEFLYLGAETEPTEEDHYTAYRGVLEAMGDLPVIIRTLDLGADKLAMLPTPEDEKNPFLGLRSIRLALSNIPLFQTQLRAILRASVYGNTKIMFPMVSTLMELRQAKMVLAEAMEDLEEKDIAFNRDVQVGIMVEVPAAVMIIDRLVDEVDFISIGTNDLIQYALAVDRGNRDVASLYTASDPSVLRLIDITLRAAEKADVPVSLCGQMSGFPRYTMLLLGLGLRSFSMTPSSLPEIKRVCREITLGECEQIAKYAMSLDTAREVRTFLSEELTKRFPDVPA